MRPREDFVSDEAYDIYLTSRQNADYTKSIFYRDSFLADVSSRNDAKLNRNFLLLMIVDIIGLLLFFAWPLARAMKYCKKEVRGDIRNNYTVKQEQLMFGAYFGTIFVLSAVLSLVYSFVNYFCWGISVFSIFNIATAAAAAFLVVAGWLIQFLVFRKMFAVK